MPGEPRNFIPLDNEHRKTVDTETAAFHVNRAAKTLRNTWAAGQGPIQPKRVNGRLHWAVDDIRRLLGAEEIAA